MSSGCKLPIVYMCQKLWKLAGSRQSYCKNYQAYFFGPPCTVGDLELVLSTFSQAFDDLTTPALSTPAYTV